jgi:hypothetical protein
MIIIILEYYVDGAAFHTAHQAALLVQTIAAL